MRRITGFVAGLLLIAVAGQGGRRSTARAGVAPPSTGSVHARLPAGRGAADMFRHGIELVRSRFRRRELLDEPAPSGDRRKLRSGARLSPLPGQIHLREQTGCVPTSEGPLCSAGTNLGAVCHLPTVNQTCTGAGAPSACCLGPAGAPAPVPEQRDESSRVRHRGRVHAGCRERLPRRDPAQRRRHHPRRTTSEVAHLHPRLRRSSHRTATWPT